MLLLFVAFLKACWILSAILEDRHYWWDEYGVVRPKRGLWYWLMPRPAGERTGVRHFAGAAGIPAHWVRNEPSALEVGMTFRTPFPFRIDAEGAGDSLAKDFGVAHEYQTGDRAFDDAVYLSCDDPWLARTLGARSHARACVLDCLRLGERIEADGQVLWIRTSPEVEERRALAWVQALRSTLLPTPAVGNTGKSPLSRLILVESVLGLGAFAGLVAGLLHFTGSSVFVDPVAAYRKGIVLSVAVVLATLWAVSRWLGRSAWAHRVLFELGLVGILGIPLGTMVLMAEVNRRFDRSLGTRSIVRVTTTSEGTFLLRKVTRVSFVAERDVAEMGLFRTLDMTGPEAIGLEPGDRLVVETGEGALGIPYYRAIVTRK